MASASNRYEETGLTGEEAMRALDRHHQRRQQDVPTLSVIFGEVDAVRIVRRWADAKGLAIAMASEPEALDAIARWFHALADTHDLTAAAYTWLARRIGGDADKLAISLPRRSTHEQELFLHRLFSGAATSPADLVCRVLIERSCESGSVASSAWDRLQTAFKSDTGGLCGGMLSLLDANRPPLLHVTLNSAVTIQRLRSFFDDLTAVVCASPRLHIVVSMDGALAGYLAGTPECRALALVREGMMRFCSWGDLPRSSTPNDDTRTPADEGPSTFNDMKTLRRDDPARSAAERYLFERLQTHPETAGLFELNGHLDCAGKGTMEIDLLARGARVAVEIDGYYHFNDPEAYRRDRRKDMQLQHAGYFVVRCLADDVVSRLEEIFESILAAVRRRGRAGEGG